MKVAELLPLKDHLIKKKKKKKKKKRLLKRYSLKFKLEIFWHRYKLFKNIGSGLHKNINMSFLIMGNHWKSLTNLNNIR